MDKQTQAGFIKTDFRIVLEGVPERVNDMALRLQKNGRFWCDGVSLKTVFDTVAPRGRTILEGRVFAAGQVSPQAVSDTVAWEAQETCEGRDAVHGMVHVRALGRARVEEDEATAAHAAGAEVCTVRILVL